MILSRTAERVGRYEIIGHLASGGMADILLARLAGESGFARAVVLKRIFPHLARVEEFEAMFLDEARIVSGIHHPNVVQVFDLGREGDELFLVMEYLEGESVSGLMRRLVVVDEKLDPRISAYVAAEVAAGLHAAHELKDANGNPQNLVHRDVSPQNVFLGYDGTVKLLDFGVAKAADRIARTEAGQVKGKASYMSPEQSTGKTVDRRSDIFSLGIMLHEMLTGRRLFHRTSPVATFRAICKDPIPSPSAIRSEAEPLDAACMRALRRSREDRFPTAEAMRFELRAVLGAANASQREELAALMRRLFADRIEQKAELMRCVRSGLSIVSVPAAETDLGAELPTILEDGPKTSAATFRTTTIRRRQWIVPVVACAGVLAAAPAWWAARSRGNPIGSAPSESLSPASAPAMSSSSSAARPSVIVSVTTEPDGARVVLGDTVIGTTPVDVPVPRGADRVTFAFEHDGYVPLTEAIVPDRDQRLRLTLVPTTTIPAVRAEASSMPDVRRSKPKPKPIRAPSPATSSSGYYQF